LRLSHNAFSLRKNLNVVSYIVRRKNTQGVFPYHPREFWYRQRHEQFSTAAERIPRPYSRAEENARELYGRFGMTTLLDIERSTFLSRFLLARLSEQF
jgi:hypothetical protein